MTLDDEVDMLMPETELKQWEFLHNVKTEQGAEWDALSDGTKAALFDGIGYVISPRPLCRRVLTEIVAKMEEEGE